MSTLDQADHVPFDDVDDEFDMQQCSVPESVHVAEVRLAPLQIVAPVGATSFYGLPEYTKPFTFDQDAVRRSESAEPWSREVHGNGSQPVTKRQGKAKFGSSVLFVNTTEWGPGPSLCCQSGAVRHPVVLRDAPLAQSG